MKRVFMLFSMCVALLGACTLNNETKSEENKFLVVSPWLTDTVYANEYVADIHSLQNVEIRARIKGHLETIHVDEGQNVRSGQLLFSISSKEYQQDLLKAKASLKSALADEKAAEVQVKSAQSLVNKKVISETELEVAQSKLEAASAKVDEAKSDEAAAILNLSFTEIRAPFDGVINRIPNKIGSLIDDGSLLTTISNNKEVYAYFNISEREYLDFRTQNQTHKDQVQLLLANNKLYRYPGTIETSESEFDKGTGNIAFRARFPNPDDLLKNGANGKIIVKRKICDAILIPQKSAFEIQDKMYVYKVKKDHTIAKQAITTQLSIHDWYVVESGLSPNDLIVFEGIQYLKEGDKITPELAKTSQITKSH